MTRFDRRLRLVADRLRPPDCHSPGATCERAAVIGDETPGEPELPKRCPRCGRPQRYTVVRIVGVDARAL